MLRHPHRPPSSAVPILVLSALIALVPVASARDLDLDGDGLTDQFEETLAAKFLPELWMSDLADRDAFFGCDPVDPRVDVPYTVEPVYYIAEFTSGLACLAPGECLLVKYGLAYHRDFGDDFWGGGHRGDSEFYVALLSRMSFDRTIVKKSATGKTCTADLARRDASCWWVMVDWTSAHQGTAADGSDFAVISPFLDTIGDGEARPVYVADGKHANYHLDEQCDAGGAPIHSDDCKPRYNVRDTCFFTLRNVGNAPALGGDGMGDGYDASIRYPESPQGLYDIWSGEDFADSSPYRPNFSIDGTDLWETWYNCVFDIPNKWVHCGYWDVDCTSDDSCTCYDACSPNYSHLACGNGVCSPGETCELCAEDCGTCPGGGGGGGAVCGNGVCESGETCETSGGTGECQADCGCCAGWQPICFVPGTPVTMADGSRRPIEQVVVGDRVLAWDETTDRLVSARVTRTWVHDGHDRELVRIDGGLIATTSHPFYVQGGQPRPAGRLTLGDRLLALPVPAVEGERAAGGGIVGRRIHRLERLAPVPTVHNLEVAGQHNFFAGGLLVHNKTATGGCEPDGGVIE